MGLKEDYDHVIAAMNTPGGVSAEQVDAAEAELGVAFPAAYRQFLAEHGAAFGDGVELAGLFARDDLHEPPLWTDVVQATKRVRRISHGALPESLVLISDNGVDVKYYLDAGLGGDGVVVALGPGVDRDVVARSFIEFVVRAASDDFHG